MSKLANVAPGLFGKRVRHIECPNEMLSNKEGVVTGTYVEDHVLTLVVLGADCKVYLMHYEWVRVLEPTNTEKES